MLSVMEPMKVTLISMIKKEGKIHARARAEAQHATINIEVRFHAEEGPSAPDHWQQARDPCLCYLDIA
jgi:hypothetical protein